MAKTTVSTIITRIKRRFDYDITDDDLDNLIVDIINDSLKVQKQLFADYALFDEIGESDTITTTASQEYIDLASETIDFDQHIVVSEREQKKVIRIIPFHRYRRMFPDPEEEAQSSPDVCAFFANRIYFGPTPSSAVDIYLDYIKLIDDVTSSSTLPFEAKYDGLLIAMVRAELAEWLDPNNAVAISAARARVDDLTNKMIIEASINSGLVRQSTSRREQDVIAPRVPDSGGFGFGQGGFGEGGFGE